MIPWTWFVVAAIVALGFATWLFDHFSKNQKELVMNDRINAMGMSITPGTAAEDYYSGERIYSCARIPKCVTIGGRQIWAGGRIYFGAKDLIGYDLVVPLTQVMTFAPGCRYQIFAIPLEDFGGVRAGFKQHVEEVVRELKSGKKIIAFCDGGLGRTGTLLASLIALMEPETKDPIAAVRERYREFAVETYAQAEAVFALRGQKPPAEYRILLEVEALRISAWTKSRI